MEWPQSPMYYRFSPQLMRFIGNDGTPNHQGLMELSFLVTGGARGEVRLLPLSSVILMAS